MQLVTQLAAARYGGISPRTIRYWIERGKLKRRRYKRVALEDVHRLVQESGKMRRTGVCGGFSGGWIKYARAGRPLGVLQPQWRHFLEKDREGQIYLYGKILEVHPDMAAAYSLIDVERSLEIRVLGWVWRRIRDGETADRIWDLPDVLRSTELIAKVPVLRIEWRLFQLLKDTSPREIFIITARLVYDYVHHATGDAAPNDVFMKPVTRKEQLVELRLNAKKGVQHQERVVPLKKEILFDFIQYRPHLQPTEKGPRGKLDAWKALKEQQHRETKYGRRMAGVEPFRSVKRWYTLASLLGLSRRMASYWKKRINAKYQEVILELQKTKTTPITLLSEKHPTLEEEIEQEFRANEQHDNPMQ